jgi:hypothetical protein
LTKRYRQARPAERTKFPLGAWDYHSSMKLIENSEKKPLRIFTHVSENDLRANDPENTYYNWVMANQRTAAALKAQGYDYRFVFSKATKHCEGKVFQQKHVMAQSVDPTDREKPDRLSGIPIPTN